MYTLTIPQLVLALTTEFGHITTPVCLSTIQLAQKLNLGVSNAELGQRLRYASDKYPWLKKTARGGWIINPIEEPMDFFARMESKVGKRVMIDDIPICLEQFFADDDGELWMRINPRHAGGRPTSNLK
jgi:hypothetical protein